MGVAVEDAAAIVATTFTFNDQHDGEGMPPGRGFPVRANVSTYFVAFDHRVAVSTSAVAGPFPTGD